MARTGNGKPQSDLFEMFPELLPSQPASTGGTIENQLLKEYFSQQRQIRHLFAKLREQEAEIENNKQWILGMASKIKQLERGSK